MTGQENKKGAAKIIYLLSFLTAAHYALTAYINSSYLENFVSPKNIGLLYVLASIATVLTIPNLSKILKKIGQFKTAMITLTADCAAILTLAATSSPLFSKTVLFPISDGAVSVENTNALIPWISTIAVISFLIFQVSLVLNYILLDIYLEELSVNKKTGGARGWFLTSINASFVVAPLISGKIINASNDGFWKIYLTSAILIALSIILVIAKLKHIKDVSYHSSPFMETFAKVTKNKNILSIYVCSLLLGFFYSWMVIYTPIYLHEEIGFDWNQIGVIFSIMLTAFVIFELPLGKIADKYLGEKEILTAGFIILAFSTGILTFIDSASLVIWATALFMTRVGASAVEIMNDTYFFKKVGPADSDVISFYRNANPMAYIIGPALASLLLYLIDYRYLFLILGTIMLLGIPFSLRIKDTL